MQIPKDIILDLLRQRGQSAQADQAGTELPDQVDTEQHAGLLQKFGLDPQEFIGKLAGGQLPGGLPGGLGGLLGG